MTSADGCQSSSPPVRSEDPAGQELVLVSGYAPGDDVSHLAGCVRYCEHLSPRRDSKQLIETARTSLLCRLPTQQTAVSLSRETPPSPASPESS